LGTQRQVFIFGYLVQIESKGNGQGRSFLPNEINAFGFALEFALEFALVFDLVRLVSGEFFFFG
jgi:hypothetical protein